MRRWSWLPALFGIGVFANAAKGQWAFNERPAGAGLIALDIVIGVACFVLSYVLWRRSTLAVAVPGAKLQSVALPTLSARRHDDQESSLQFGNDAQRECYTAVRNWVSALYGESAGIDEDRPRFFCPVMDILVGILVRALGEKEAEVNIWTFPLDQAPQELTERAMRWMLETNARYLFGSLGILPDSDGVVVALEYDVEWQGLTKDRLQSLVVTIAHMTRDVRVDLARELTG
jgi:Putative bacterial sensory transduction regulator